MENKSKDIKIAKVELSDYGIKLSDQDGMVFNISEETKDGRISNAWEQYENMKLKIGSQVNVWYAETPNKHGGVSRYIRNFKEVNSETTQTPAAREIAQPGAGSGAIRPYRNGNDAFGRRLAVHGLVNGLLAGGIAPKDIDIQSVLELEDRINKALEIEDIPLPEF